MSVSIPVERLLDQGLANQRATVRYRCGPAMPGRVYLNTDLIFMRAWIRDLSLEGLGLLVEKPLDPGAFIVLQLKSPSSGEKYQISAEVMHCTAVAGEYLVGCHFVSALTEDTLEDLL